MEAFLADVRHALRQLWRSPSFTFAAVAALALGIGVNTAIFSVVDAVLLKPVPFPDPDRLVMFMNTTPRGRGPGASPAKFATWRKETGVIQDAAAIRTGVINYTGGDVPEQLRFAQVSADYFKLLGAPIVRGRVFSEEEDSPGGPQGLTRFIASFLFGVQTRDPLVFVGIPLVLAIVALVAVWLPAMRASRVDPLTALRYE